MWRLDYFSLLAWIIGYQISLACKAIVGEIDYAIKQIDPKKTMDIGGRETRAVKYAGSETHLIEVLESVWLVLLVLHIQHVVSPAL